MGLIPLPSNRDTHNPRGASERTRPFFEHEFLEWTSDLSFGVFVIFVFPQKNTDCIIVDAKTFSNTNYKFLKWSSDLSFVLFVTFVFAETS